MPFSLTIQEIRKVCGPTYYQRGLNYQRQGRVLVAEWDEEGQLLFGEVKGSGRKVYQQEILFEPESNDHFAGYCTCPVANDCKHVVAVLLEWIELNLEIFTRQCNPDPQNLLNWQQTTQQLLQGTTEANSPAPGNACLLYVLQPQGEGREQSLHLQTLKSRHLKRGGWGKMTPCALSDLIGYYNPPAGTLAVDKEIAHLLSTTDSYRYSNSYNLPRLEGDIGLLALQRLLGTGRCFFLSTDQPPLRRGPQRRADFQWQKQGELTRLNITLEPQETDWLLIPTTPPWYLNRKTAQCGFIEQPFAASQLRALTTLPPVAEDQLTELSYFLLRQFPPKTIPLPAKIEIHHYDQAPQAQLILHGVVDDFDGRRYHLARLRFKYGPVNLMPLASGEPPLQLIQHLQETWQITRQVDIEQNSLALLLQHGLVPALTHPDSPELDLFFATSSLQESALAWRDFLQQVPELAEQGWQVDVDPSFQLSFETATEVQAEIEESQMGWFEVGLNIEHAGHKIALLPLLTQWLEHKDPQQPLLHLLGGDRWLEIPATVLEPVVKTLVELYQDPQLNDSGQLKLPRPQAHGLLELEEQLTAIGHQFVWQGGKKLRRLAAKLKNFQGIQEAPLPQGLNAELRDYQRQGLSWLQFLREYEFGGVLADDMGLGKTIQALAHLQLEKEGGRLENPVLIVAPTSVISNWQREAARFTPELKTLVLHGSGRSAFFNNLVDYDLIITSYALLTRDLEHHMLYTYHSLILDEAQAIKNPRAKSALAACSIKADHRFCLTGTPMENHLGELWSLFQFLMPGFLGSQKRFTQLFRTPIEKHHDSERQQQLQQRIAPFVLRRDKTQVVLELPPKTQMVREVELNAAQSKLYESLRLAMTDKVGKLLQQKGLKKSHIEILAALLKLRQVCCDPRLVKLESARAVKQSSKLEALLALLDVLLEEGRKVLIFSQFTSMLSLIESELQARDIAYTKLTGRTRKRDEVIQVFQNGSVPVFLISLKAGGVGLNLTAADAVIHYDPWWNPAVENQATDRAHRIGQQKPVFVYKLVAKGTLEEKILKLQEQKQLLADGIYQQRDQPEQLPGMSSEDILSLLTAIE